MEVKNPKSWSIKIAIRRSAATAAVAGFFLLLWMISFFYAGFLITVGPRGSFATGFWDGAFHLNSSPRADQWHFKADLSRLVRPEEGVRERPEAIWFPILRRSSMSATAELTALLIPLWYFPFGLACWIFYRSRKLSQATHHPDES